MESEDLIEAFYTIDRDKSGYITVTELNEYLRGQNFDTKFVKDFLMVFDTNNDGKISFTEYKNTLHTIPKQHIRYSQLRCAFERMDRDGDGYITEKELVESFSTSSCSSGRFKVSDLRKFIKKVDKDGDGRINYTELLNYMLSDD